MDRRLHNALFRIKMCGMYYDDIFIMHKHVSGRSESLIRLGCNELIN